MANTLNFNIKTSTDFSDLAKLKKELNEIRNLARNSDFVGITSQEEIDNMIRSANQLEQAMDRAFDYDLNTVNIEKFNKILRDSGTNITEVQKGLSLAGDTGQKAFLTATTQLLKFNNITSKTNTLLDKMATTMGNTIKWSITSSLWNNITGSIQKSFYYVKDLDSALNDIRIVTEKSSEDMAHFAVQANNAAKALSTSTQDYTEGALIYYQQGLDDDTVQTLTDITAKAANVTGQSMEAVSEQLTAVWNGYRVANQAATEGLGVYQEYVDKMAAVGAITASDLEEIATAMSKVSSAASSMGVDFDDLNAQIATIVSVTRQAPETVGNALKTIYARMGDLKLDGVDEFGVQLGEVSGQLEGLGIEILDNQGNIRDMSGVIQDVAGQWDKWTEAQKRAAAEAMAGKRQYNNLIALFDNWDMYTNALVTSQEAMGTLEKQNDTALESMRNKMETLSATAEDLYNSLFDEESIIDLVEGLTTLTQGLADFTEGVGGLKTILPAVGSIGASIFSKQIASGIGDAVKNLTLFSNKTKQAQANFFEIQTMFGENGAKLFGETMPSAGVDSAQAQNFAMAKQFYDEIAQKQSLMNENELQAAQLIQQNIAEYGELNIEHEEQVKSLQASNEQLGLFKDLADQTSLNNTVVATKDMAANLQRIANTFEETDKGAKGVQTSVQKLTKELKKSGVFDDKAFQKGGIFKKLEKDIAAAGTNTKALKHVLKEAAAELENMGNAGDSIAKLETKMAGLKSRVDSTGESLKNSLKPKEMTENFVNATSALGSLSSAVSSFAQLPKIFSNEDLTTGEKIFETISALTTTVTMLGFAISTLTRIEAIKLALDKVKQGWLDLYSGALSKVIGKEVAATGAAVKAAGANAGLAGSFKAAAMAAQGFFASLGPIGWMVIAATALATAIAGVALATAKANKEKIEENKENIERIDGLQKEIDSTNELRQSYLNMYDAYQKGNATKEDMARVTQDLAEYIDKEAAAVARLTGNYSSLTDEIIKAQKEKAEEALGLAQEELDDAGDTLERTKGKGSYKSGNNYGMSITVTDAKDREAYDLVADVFGPDMLSGSGTKDLMGDTLSILTTSDAKHIAELYDKMTEAKNRLKQTYGEDAKDLVFYERFDQWQDSVEESVTVYKNAVADVEKYSTQFEGLGINFQEATDIESFREKRTALITAMKKQFPDKEDPELMAMVDVWISKQGDAVKQLADKMTAFDSITANITDKDAKDEIEALINDLNDEDLGIVLGHLEFSRVETAEELKNEIEFIKHSLKEADITVSVQLATEAQDKLLKGEELDAEARKKLQESFDAAGVEFDWEAFDSANRGDQIEMYAQAMRDLSDATLEAYESGEKYRKQHEDKIAENEEAIKTEEDRVARILADLETEKGPSVRKRLNDELADAKAELERLRAEAEHLKATTFQTQFDAKVQQYTSDVESITSQVGALKLATDAIDGGFIVAAEDAQTLAELYPELYKDSEVLADGRIQLDEKAVQTYLANRQKEYEKNREVTQKELAYDIEVLQKKVESNTATQEEINLLGQLMALYAELQGANFDFLVDVGKVDTEGIEKLIDRYHDVNVSIKTVENSLNKLKQKQNGLVGDDLIKSLEEENKLLDQINNQYEIKKTILGNEKSELGNDLSKKYGVTFDENGKVTNYTDIWNQQKAKLEKDTSASDEKAREAAIKYFETFEEELARYEEIVLEEIPGLSETIADNLRTQVENNFKTWEIRFEKGLDLAEWEKSVDDFLRETKKDVTKTFSTDIASQMDEKNNPLQSYLEGISLLIDGTKDPSDSGKGGITSGLKELIGLFEELQNVGDGGTSNMFGSFGEGADLLKGGMETLMSQTQSIREEVEAAHDTYLDAIDQANDFVDQQYDKLQRVSGQLEFCAQWVELIYGPEAYDMMYKIYNSQIKNSLASVGHLKEEAALWKQRYEAETESEEAKTKYYELWIEAEDELNNKVIEHIELLKDDYANTISRIIDNLEKEITKGFSLDEISEEWDRQKEHSDKYLNNVESLYEIQTLANKINGSIADTSSVANQQKLQKLYDKEITNLKQIQNLTKTDVEMAEKRYEIALKEMALEDARNTKNSIKMVRGSDGNWSYQYVAEEEKVEKAQQDLSKSYNDLYQLTKDAYEDSVESLLDLKKNFVEGLEEIYNDETLTEEQRTEKIKKLREQYENDLNILAEKHNKYRQDLPNVTAGILYNLYQQDKDNYKEITDEEKDLIDGLRKAGIEDFQDLEDKAVANFENIGDKAETAFSGVDKLWKTDAAELAKVWTGDTESLDEKINEAITDMNDSVTSFKNELTKLEKTSGKTFGYGEGDQYGLLQALKNANKDTDAVKTRMGLLDDATGKFYKTLNDNLKNYKKKMGEVKSAWDPLLSAITTAITDMQTYLLLKAQAEGDSELPPPPKDPDGGGGSETGDGTGPKTPGTVTTGTGANKKFLVQYPEGSYSAALAPELGGEEIDETALRQERSNLSQRAQAADAAGNFGEVDRINQRIAEIDVLLALASSKTSKTSYGGGGGGNTMALMRGGTSAFAHVQLYDTGGYTGDWGKSGKMAILHEKELVLNQEDTKNILNVVSLVRGISDKIKSTAASALAGLAGGHMAYAGNSVVTEGATTFEIHAEFPNANNVNDIREAILSLPNYASQFNGRR